VDTNSTLVDQPDTKMDCNSLGNLQMTVLDGDNGS